MKASGALRPTMNLRYPKKPKNSQAEPDQHRSPPPAEGHSSDSGRRGGRNAKVATR